MNPEGLLSGIARLRSLGLPDDDADPLIVMWSRGKRGLRHLERNCSTISSFSVIRHSQRAGSLPVTRFCRRCLERGVSLNNQLLYQRIDVSRVLKQFEQEQGRCDRFPWRLPLLIRQMKSTITQMEESVDTNVDHEFRSLLVQHIRDVVASVEADAGYGLLEQSLMREVATEILIRKVREDSRARDHALFPPGGVGSLPTLYATWCGIWAESGDFDSARQGVRHQLGDTSLRSLSQLDFFASGPPPEEMTVLAWVQQAWRESTTTISERLMDDWEVQVNHELGSPERTRLLSYSCRHDPDGLLASVTEYYKVVSSVRGHVVRVPGVVARWLIEQKRLNLLGSISEHDAHHGDDVVRTAVTLHEDDNSTYSSLGDAFEVAARL
jgi:hypothetical protein